MTSESYSWIFSKEAGSLMTKSRDCNQKEGNQIYRPKEHTMSSLVSCIILRCIANHKIHEAVSEGHSGIWADQPGSQALYAAQDIGKLLACLDL